VTVVADVTAATLFKLTVKKVRRGAIVYMDKFKSYDSFKFCGYRHFKVDHQKCFCSGKVYINGLEGFWGWAKASDQAPWGFQNPFSSIYQRAGVPI
jgi:transposase